MRRRMRRSSGGKGPSRTWVSLSDGWNLNLSATTATALMTLQAPTTLTLTSDPPEDIIIDRIVGDMVVGLSAAISSWTLALIVQDATWTPGTFPADADKRLLWVRQYDNPVATAAQWSSGNFWTGTAASSGFPDWSRVDIAPRVRLEPGQSLYLVAYENSGAATLTSTGTSVRMLFHRAKRSR